MAKRNGSHRNGKPSNGLARETPRESALPTLVTPSHGNGQLYSGGVPGNKGGGRKPAAWKAACEQALEDAKAIPVLKSIVSGDILERIGTDKDGKPIYGETRNSDRIGAIKFLATEAWGSESATAIGAQIETPDGTTFTLLIGDRGEDA